MSTQVRPKNLLVPVILMELQQWDSYGYELMEKTARFWQEALNPGTLYRALRQMEKKGLCTSEWEISNDGGPARRVYAVTNEGEAYLEEWVEGCKKYQQVIDAFSLAYDARGANPP